MLKTLERGLGRGLSQILTTPHPRKIVTDSNKGKTTPSMPFATSVQSSTNLKEYGGFKRQSSSPSP